MKKGHYKKIIGYFKEEKRLVILYILFSIITVILGSITPFLSAKGLSSITNADLNGMLKYAILIFIADVIGSMVYFGNHNCSNKIQNNVEIKIKKDVSSELFNLEMQNYDKVGTGFFSSRINNEPGYLASIFSSLRYSLSYLFTSFGVLVYVFITNYILGIYFVLSSIILFLLKLKRTKRWEKDRKKRDSYEEKYVGNFTELIRGIKDIKVLNLKQALIEKTAKEQYKNIALNHEIRRRDELSYLLSDFVHGIIQLFFIVIGILLIKNKLILASTFLIIYMYKGKAFGFVDTLSDLYRSYKEFNLSLERLYEIVDGIKYKKEKFGNIHIDEIKGNIEFKNTSFGYDDNLVLNDVSFKINANETIGIVGKSGVGKTTIFNLINKLYNVKNNSIFIDDVDINDLDEETIRDNISTITQNPYIFNMSIKDNLRLVDKEITDEEIVNKCKTCLLDDYISSLKDGYDTVLGENGVILSGGLKQRLAIARALLKKSKIILLDEATSFLDNETQDHIHDAIKHIRNDYTILIIAHRLSTVIDCDRIIVMDGGKIAGFDTHDNLIKKNKIYQRLYKKELIKEND